MPLLDSLCATVERIGEDIAEFGYSPIALKPWILSWELRVWCVEESDAMATTVLSGTASKSVVDLRPGKEYLAQVRVQREDRKWTEWSLPPTKTRTFCPVSVSVTQVRETSVRLHWDRQPRDTHGIAAEVELADTIAFADINRFQIKLLKCSDMSGADLEEFPAGTRAHVFTDLKPDTVYVIFGRYLDVFGRFIPWSEVGRVRTSPPLQVSLCRRGENTITVQWGRKISETDTADTVSQTSLLSSNGSQEHSKPIVAACPVSKYELIIVGDSWEGPFLLFDATKTEHTFTGLTPSALYRVRVRACTEDGVWGTMSEALKVCCAGRISLRLVEAGETFLRLMWTREIEELLEASVEFLIYRADCHLVSGMTGREWLMRGKTKKTELHDEQQAASDRGEQTGVIILNGNGDRNERLFRIDGLDAGTEYCVKARVLLIDEWGGWSELINASTRESLRIEVSQRGEHFITIALPRAFVGQKCELICSRWLPRETEELIARELLVVSNDNAVHRFENLTSGATYVFQGRAWQGSTLEATWGQLSGVVCARTLCQMSVQITDVGESFAAFAWARSGVKRSENNHIDLKYEVVLGCIDTGEDSLFQKEIFESTFSVDTLKPNTRYIFSVRGGDEDGNWGTWRWTEFNTPAPLILSLHEIGESFVRVMWMRADVAAVDKCSQQNSSSGAEIHSEPDVSFAAAGYEVYIYSEDAAEDTTPSRVCDYPHGGASEISFVEFLPSPHTSIRLSGLLPDRTYACVVRAAAASQSSRPGSWSAPVRFHTMAPLRFIPESLAVGEDYLRVAWCRDEPVNIPPEVLVGNCVVLHGEMRVSGVGTATPLQREITFGGTQKEAKVCDLTPGTLYDLRLRICTTTGEWGRWSPPFRVLTRETISLAAEEIAEDYIIVSWSRSRQPKRLKLPLQSMDSAKGCNCESDGKIAATGRGAITAFRLRVFNVEGVTLETFVFDEDCPYVVSNLKPDTYYCVEMRANYNDEEWGLWSTPVWCLTLKMLSVRAEIISEEYCTLRIFSEPARNRLPEDDGNNGAAIVDGRNIIRGKQRSLFQIFVSTRNLLTAPFSSLRASSIPSTLLSKSSAVSGTAETAGKGSEDSRESEVPKDCAGERIVQFAEILADGGEALHTVKGLRAGSLYSVSVRSKICGGRWGMWMQPSVHLATVPQLVVDFNEIGSSFANITWRRGEQDDTLHLENPSAVIRGPRSINASRVKVRDSANHFTIYNLTSNNTFLLIPDLKPFSTYSVYVQALGGSGDWGVWSKETQFITTAQLEILIEGTTEDAVWVSWLRSSASLQTFNVGTFMHAAANTDEFEVAFSGAGSLEYTQRLKDSSCFLTGLVPGALYEVRVRESTISRHWEPFTRLQFTTLPKMFVTYGKVGEHFCELEWRRGAAFAVREERDRVVLADDSAESFRVRIERAASGDQECVESWNGEEAEFLEEEWGPNGMIAHFPADRSTFTVRGLRPCTEYRVWACSRGYKGTWGPWSDESRFRTSSRLLSTVDDVGENYIVIHWGRDEWKSPPSSSSDCVNVRVGEVVVSSFEVKVRSTEGVDVAIVTVPHRNTRTTVAGLNPSTYYEVSVRCCDTHKEWGLWAPPQRFETLPPVSFNLIAVGEVFVELEWGRVTTLIARETAQERAERKIAGEQSVESEEDEGGAVNLQGNRFSKKKEGNEEETEKADDTQTSNVASDNVNKWMIRVYGNRLNCAEPVTEDSFLEFLYDGSTRNATIDGLHPDSEYSIAIKAQNLSAEWGVWSTLGRFHTLPLLAAEAIYIGEDLFKISWRRAQLVVPPDSTYVFPFPPPNGVHNYQVAIRPFNEHEHQFPDHRETLVDGCCRVYETSQENFTLTHLFPGTRYSVRVREQLLSEENHTLIPDSFGAYSEPLFVRTTPLVHLTCSETSEDRVLLSWARDAQRKKDDREPADYLFLSSTARTAEVELRLARLAPSGDRLFKGPAALYVTRFFPATVTSFDVGNLIPNSIYCTVARVRMEGEEWGLWSEEVKFITQRRLRISVDVIDEHRILVSWLRELPDWLIDRNQSDEKQQKLPNPNNDVVCSEEIDEHLQAQDEQGVSARRFQSPFPLRPAPPDLADVLLPTGTVKAYEVHILGLSIVFDRTMLLSSTENSAFIEGLQCNHLYEISVRSLSIEDYWSSFSPAAVFCTPHMITLSVSHFTENSTAVEWLRPAQSVSEHAPLLDARRARIVTEAEADAQQARFQRQQILQAHADLGHEFSEEQFMALSARVERSAAMAEEARISLDPNNVFYSAGKTLGYQLRVWGDGGFPFVCGHEHLLPAVQSPQSPGIMIIGEISDVFTQKLLGSSATNTGAENAGSANADADCSDHSKPNLLLDLYVNPGTSGLRVEGFIPGAEYDFEIRAMSATGTWCLWSTCHKLTTLPPLSIRQTRFGEHYINLCWFRHKSEEENYERERREKLAQLNTQYGNMTVADLRKVKEEESQEAYVSLLTEMSQWRNLQCEIDEYEASCDAGFAPVVSAPGMSVVGYYIRIISEVGTVQQQYVEQGVHQYTLSGLMHNSVYVILICAHYLGDGGTVVPDAYGHNITSGNFFGVWSKPLKIMTQNLIQLNVLFAGEHFIDVEWCRSLNKNPAVLDRHDTVISTRESGAGKQYQIVLTHIDAASGEEVVDFRTVKDQNVFRIEDLESDTCYNLRVRELDPKGEWGIYSAEKRCVTLARMQLHIDEVGERFMDVSWERAPSKLQIDYEDPMLIQFITDVQAYYLMVEEIVDSNECAFSNEHKREFSTNNREEGLYQNADLEERRNCSERSTNFAISSKEDATDKLEKESILFLSSREASLCSCGDALTRLPRIPPDQAPQEVEPVNSACPWLLVRRFAADTQCVRIDDLESDHFYRVSVRAQTVAGYLGRWSESSVVLTISAIVMHCTLINELTCNVGWSRAAPQINPRFDVLKPIFVEFNTQGYELHAWGSGSRNKNYKVEKILSAGCEQFVLDDLVLHDIYTVQVRATSTREQVSDWSEPLHFVTLPRMRVLLCSIAEEAVVLSWSRAEQHAEDYLPLREPPLVVPLESPAQHQLQVFDVGTEWDSNPFLDKELPVGINYFILRTPLQPNSAYVARCRTRGPEGEWGLWSLPRVFYTMKPLLARVITVGEDYIRAAWSRSAPDELPVLSSECDPAQLAQERDALLREEGSAQEEEVGETISANFDGPRASNDVKKRYPLLDVSSESTKIYCSTSTDILRYEARLTVPHGSPEEEKRVKIENKGTEDCSWCTIDKLNPDKVYELTARAIYSLKPPGAKSIQEIGQWSKPVQTGTLNLLHLRCRNIGEDYGIVEWARGPNSFPLSAVSLGSPEKIMFYEAQAQDFTEIPIGNEDAVEPSELVVQKHFVEGNSVRFSGFSQNRYYKFLVRRWYMCANPGVRIDNSEIVGEFNEHVEDVSADRNESTEGNKDSTAVGTGAEVTHAEETAQQFRHLISSGRVLPGVWSEGTFAATLRRMVVTIADIGERSITVCWERDPNCPPLHCRKLCPIESVVQSYHLRVDELTQEGNRVDAALIPFKADSQFGPEQSSFRVCSLRPDTTYRLEVRCCADQVWGPWSAHVLAITLPRLLVVASFIGEHYAKLEWKRCLRQLTTSDGIVAAFGSIARVERFELIVSGLTKPFTFAKRFEAAQADYCLENLVPGEAYEVQMRSCSPEGEWSLWSEPLRFAALRPVHLHIAKVAEDWSAFFWGREKQSKEEYTPVVEEAEARAAAAGNGGIAPKGILLLGNSEPRGFQLCIFSLDCHPSVAVFDRDFAADVRRFRVCGLNPGGRYVAVVRALDAQGDWGLWSHEIALMLQRRITTSVRAVGENYMCLRWSRETAPESQPVSSAEERSLLTKSAPQTIPVAMHLCLAADSETLDVHFTLEDCTEEVLSDDRAPQKVDGVLAEHETSPLDHKESLSLVSHESALKANNSEKTKERPCVHLYTVRGLRTNTKYALSLQANYGNHEWGSWSEPLVVLTLNALTIEVGSITESSAEFSWARKAQDPDVANDISVLVWRSAIVKYQLLIRKVAEMEAQELREAARRAAGMEHRLDGSLLATDPVTHEELEVGSEETLEMGETVQGEEAINVPTSDIALLTPAAYECGVEQPHFFFEQELRAADGDAYAQTSARVDGLIPATEYHCQVRALDEYGQWGYWSEVFFDTPPAPPSGLVLRKLEQGGAELTWMPGDGINSYRYEVEQALAPEPPKAKKKAPKRQLALPPLEWSSVASLTDVTSYACFEADKVNRLNYRVRCCKLNSLTRILSRYSAEISFVNNPIPPPPVRKLEVSSLSRNSAEIVWENGESTALALVPPQNMTALTPAPPSNVKFVVYFGAGDRELCEVGTVRVPRYELEGLDPMTTYRVSIVASSSAGTSTQNPTVIFTTLKEDEHAIYTIGEEHPELGHVEENKAAVALPVTNSKNILREKTPSSVSGKKKSLKLTPKPPLEAADRPRSGHAAGDVPASGFATVVGSRPSSGKEMMGEKAEHFPLGTDKH